MYRARKWYARDRCFFWECISVEKKVLSSKWNEEWSRLYVYEICQRPKNKIFTLQIVIEVRGTNGHCDKTAIVKEFFLVWHFCYCQETMTATMSARAQTAKKIAEPKYMLPSHTSAESIRSSIQILLLLFCCFFFSSRDNFFCHILSSFLLPLWTVKEASQCFFCI